MDKRAQSLKQRAVEALLSLHDVPNNDLTPSQIISQGLGAAYTLKHGMDDQGGGAVAQDLKAPTTCKLAVMACMSTGPDDSGEASKVGPAVPAAAHALNRVHSHRHRRASMPSVVYTAQLPPAATLKLLQDKSQKGGDNDGQVGEMRSRAMNWIGNRQGVNTDAYGPLPVPYDPLLAEDPEAASNVSDTLPAAPNVPSADSERVGGWPDEPLHSGPHPFSAQSAGTGNPPARGTEGRRGSFTVHVLGRNHGPADLRSSMQSGGTRSAPWHGIQNGRASATLDERNESGNASQGWGASSSCKPQQSLAAMADCCTGYGNDNSHALAVSGADKALNLLRGVQDSDDPSLFPSHSIRRRSVDTPGPMRRGSLDLSTSASHRRGSLDLSASSPSLRRNPTLTGPTDINPVSSLPQPRTPTTSFLLPAISSPPGSFNRSSPPCSPKPSFAKSGSAVRFEFTEVDSQDDSEGSSSGGSSSGGLQASTPTEGSGGVRRQPSRLCSVAYCEDQDEDEEEKSGVQQDPESKNIHNSEGLYFSSSSATQNVVMSSESACLLSSEMASCVGSGSAAGRSAEGPPRARSDSLPHTLPQGSRSSNNIILPALSGYTSGGDNTASGGHRSTASTTSTWHSGASNAADDQAEGGGYFAPSSAKSSKSGGSSRGSFSCLADPRSKSFSCLSGPRGMPFRGQPDPRGVSFNTSPHPLAGGGGFNANSLSARPTSTQPAAMEPLDSSESETLDTPGFQRIKSTKMTGGESFEFGRFPMRSASCMPTLHGTGTASMKGGAPSPMPPRSRLQQRLNKYTRPRMAPTPNVLFAAGSDPAADNSNE